MADRQADESNIILVSSNNNSKDPIIGQSPKVLISLKLISSKWMVEVDLLYFSESRDQRHAMAWISKYL